SHLRAVANDFIDLMAQIGLSIAFMAHTAGLMFDAVGRTLHRMLVSHRMLLEWRTAQQVNATSADGLGHYYLLMWVSPVIAIGVVAIVLAANPANAPI